jgi:hypothetical protein
MVNISLLEHMECLNYVIKLDGLIHSIKFKLAQFKNFHGLLMELFVLDHVEVEMLFSVKS